MRPIRSKLGINNRRDAPQVVAVEPWGEDFTLMPGEKLEVVAYSDSDSATPWFYVVEWEGTSQVYCNDTGDFEVLQGGVRLECGHNRSPEPATSFHEP
ncbi:MAG: hypothetical protein ABI353_16660 [Isosphaeraceae bacterium]